MVAKISSGSSIYSALAYNHDKLKKDAAKVLLVNKMIEPVDGKYSIGLCSTSFEPYLSANKRTENPVIHISLNPDPKDKLSDEQFTQLAELYMNILGYGNQPYIVYKHEDIDRHHLHIVSVKVDETGKMIRDNFQHRLSMRICRELEQKFGLTPANEKQKDGVYNLKPVDYKKGDLKHQIANVVRPVAGSWYFQSFKEYKALHSLYNVHVAEVRGEKGGKLFHGIVYAALDEKGEVFGNPIKSSKFGKTTGYEVLQVRIEKSKEHIKNIKLKERPKQVISDTFQKSRNRKDFETKLLKQGISVLFWENDAGRIYGATFIDHKQKFVFNGSRLGKDFSANVFNERFGTQKQQQEETQSPQSDTTKHPEQANSSFENLSGLLEIQPLGENYEEEAFIRRMKRKKRRIQK
ncbi:Relaxase/Mobilisation nuclease domain-containing protein [Mariniphaga anaerophila]|uniref:Relaxase/Mobilisation nuclease domain-containing protein n=1 Tax=Mariniphaga anaerophila TaxID=1484053 RepID=A0A1M4U282_9BACT|nr:conjugal transfer protein MobB [Mariniphaga anaerophila]SHE50706.1 Relaxase/Mobilisation nuclease domain-containing protein [Mariniphaga anaerophila]